MLIALKDVSLHPTKYPHTWRICIGGPAKEIRSGPLMR
jgi:hypothetical protein